MFSSAIVVLLVLKELLLAHVGLTWSHMLSGYSCHRMFIASALQAPKVQVVGRSIQQNLVVLFGRTPSRALDHFPTNHVTCDGRMPHL